MKKSKVILAIALAVILLVTIMNAPTFSWFSRPHSQTGAQTVLGGSSGTYSLNAYNGKSVTVSTMGSATGVEGSYTIDCNAANACDGTNVPNNNRKYFCTTLTNESGTAQNVSLYARTLSIPTGTNGTLAIGVNGPTRSYRDYSSLATPTRKTASNSMRVYFQKPTSAPDGWAGTEFYICFNEDTNTSIESLNSTGSNGTYYKMTYCGSSSGYYNYYVDIPKTATHAFFAVENWGTNNNGQPNYKQRTQTLWNLAGDGQTQTQSVVYTLTSTVTNGNTTVRTPGYAVDGACINTYYDKIFVGTTTFNAALASTEYSTNGTIKYYSGDTSIFTVNETSGVITPVSTGEAKLYTKIIGSSFSDEQQVETTVHVTMSAYYIFNDVMIVKNVKIPASTTNDANVVKVYWYVINNSPTTALTYKIDNVYVGL